MMDHSQSYFTGFLFLILCIVKGKNKFVSDILDHQLQLQSLGPISGAAVILPQLDNNNNNKLANQKIEMLAGGLLRR